MSGPKTSDYTLTAAQQRILEEQRKERLKKAEEYKRISKLKEKIHSLTLSSEHSEETAKLCVERCGTDNGYFKAYSGIADKLRTAVGSVTPDNASLKTLHEIGDMLEHTLYEANKAKAELLAITRRNEEAVQKDTILDIDKAFAEKITQKETPDKIEYQQLAAETHQRILALLGGELSNELIISVQKAEEQSKKICDIKGLRNFIAITVVPLEKECKHYSDMLNEYDQLQIRYETLCDALERSAEKTECSAYGISKLKSDISVLEKSMVEQEEQRYISQCIDDIMTELGYDLIGERSVTKKSGKRFRNELYHFGNGTAVNVTYSSGGQITMELGALDSSDRAPTRSECDRLCADMEQFCEEYAKVERRLEEKGVISRHIQLLPPLAEYAQIINTEDYRMSGEVGSPRRNTETQIKTRKIDE